MHPSPNISKRSVIGCVAKYELTKKGVGLMDEFFSEIEIFHQEKGHIIMLYIGFQTVIAYSIEMGKDRQIMVDMTKKVIRIFWL